MAFLSRQPARALDYLLVQTQFILSLPPSGPGVNRRVGPAKVPADSPPLFVEEGGT